MGELPLLSEKLLNIADEAAASDMPVMKLWAQKHINEVSLKEGVFDEMEVMQSVRRMLMDTDMFLFEPKMVRDLRDIYERVEENREEYLENCMKKQKQRIQRILNGLEYLTLDKQKRNLTRHLARKNEEYSKIRSVEGQQMVIEQLKSQVDQYLKARIGKHPSGILNVVADMDTVVGRLEDMEDAALERIEDRLKRCVEATKDIQQKLEVIEMRIRNKARLLKILEDTEKYLSQNDGSSMVQQNVPVAVLPKSTVSTEKPFAKKKVRKKESRSEEDVDEKRSDSDRPSNPNELDWAHEKSDVERLNEVIAYAEEADEKIRVLVSKKHAGSHKKKWRKVFEKLGYEGALEFCTYRNLATSSDYDSPVIVPRGMNTHQERWNRKNFAYVIVTEVYSPNQLLTLVGNGV